MKNLFRTATVITALAAGAVAAKDKSHIDKIDNGSNPHVAIYDLFDANGKRSHEVLVGCETPVVRVVHLHGREKVVEITLAERRSVGNYSSKGEPVGSHKETLIETLEVFSKNRGNYRLTSEENVKAEIVKNFDIRHWKLNQRPNPMDLCLEGKPDEPQVRQKLDNFIKDSITLPSLK